MEYVETTRAKMLELADRCERGAAELKHTAENAAAVLAERGYGDDTRVDPAVWGEQKRRAAIEAAAYAAELRREAEALGENEQPSADRIRQAERVARASEMGGILIDTREADEHRIFESSHTHSGAHEHERELWQSDSHPAQTKASEVEGSGRFGHVDEVIDGHKQVPFWQLGAQSLGAELTPAQQRLYDDVMGDPDGKDLRDVLDAADAAPADKAAVANELGGPGAGDRFICIERPPTEAELQAADEDAAIARHEHYNGSPVRYDADGMTFGDGSTTAWPTPVPQDYDADEL